MLDDCFFWCWMIFFWVVGDSKRCECEVIVRTYGSFHVCIFEGARAHFKANQ